MDCARRRDRATWATARTRGAVLSLSKEFYWNAANSVGGTVGSLDLSAGDGSDRGDGSAFYLAASISDFLEAGIHGGVGMEVRLGQAVGLRLDARIHALAGDGPPTVATGTLGVSMYY